jgi:hypothetical protein
MQRVLRTRKKLTVALPPPPAVDAVEESADDYHHQDRDHYGHPFGARMSCSFEQEHHEHTGDLNS